MTWRVKVEERVVEIRRDSARVGIGEIFLFHKNFLQIFFQNIFFSKIFRNGGGSWVRWSLNWAPLEKRGPIRRGLWKGPSSCTS